jgi:hypothetical protein
MDRAFGLVMWSTAWTIGRSFSRVLLVGLVVQVVIRIIEDDASPRSPPAET